MAVNGKFGGITRDDLLRLADRFAIGPAPKIIDQVVDAFTDWTTFAHKAGLNPTTVQSIAADFRSL
jgi:serine/threonine-protein kinase HipA